MLFAPKDTQLECAPNHHLIDRRQLVVEKDPTTGRDLKDRENQVCMCGKLNAHAAEYRGGAFTYVYAEGGPEQAMQKMHAEGGVAGNTGAEERRS